MRVEACARCGERFAARGVRPDWLEDDAVWCGACREEVAALKHERAAFRCRERARVRRASQRRMVAKIAGRAALDAHEAGR